MKPKFYRAMKPDQKGLFPRIGNDSQSLGVRLLTEGATVDDIPVSAGLVAGGQGGMSVNRSKGDLPFFLIPKIFASLFPKARGNNSLIAWNYGIDPFQDSRLTEKLFLRIDPAQAGHGFVEPSETMLLEEYRAAINDTQTQWVAEAWECNKI